MKKQKYEGDWKALCLKVAKKNGLNPVASWKTWTHRGAIPAERFKKRGKKIPLREALGEGLCNHYIGQYGRKIIPELDRFLVHDGESEAYYRQKARDLGNWIKRG